VFPLYRASSPFLGGIVLSLKRILTVSVLTSLLAAGQDKPTPPHKPAASAAASPVDNVIKLLKSGMSESLIIKTLQKQKPYSLSPEEMVKLKQAGASDKIIEIIMDPTAAPAAPTAAVAAAAQTLAAPTTSVSDSSGTSCPPPAGVSAGANASKRRVAVSPFDYAAVKTAVTSIAGNDVNIGQGIRSMLMVKMAQSKTVVLLEREKIKAVMGEQDFDATNRVKQGTKAHIGNITGADAMLFGDIVTFGRDDKTKGNSGGGVERVLPGPFGGIAGGIRKAKQTDKAVVVINLRLVDAETSEVIDSEEARGESTRTSTNWGAVAGTWRGGAGGGAGMTDSNFGETIIGEATQDAVNKIAAILEQKMPAVAAKSRTIEGKVSTIDGCTLYISVGGNDGVHVGDHFEIHKVIKDVIDPDTKEILDHQTVKVGDFIVSTVRDKVSIGQYGGQPIMLAGSKGYAARMATQ
jgi:curli biogenesis system outer membrane secretion channel CsgG